MPYCANCGAPVEGRFCAKCGSPAGPDALKPESAAPSKPELELHLAAALCYLPGFVAPILFLLWAPYSRDKTVRFHAFQAIFLQLVWLVAIIVLGNVVPWISWRLWMGLERLVHLAGLLLSAFLFWKTFQKEEIVLPHIGPMARKQA